MSYRVAEPRWTVDMAGPHDRAPAAAPPAMDAASRRRARRALTRYVDQEPAHAVLLAAGCARGDLLTELAADWPHALVIGSDIVEPPLRQLAAHMPTMPLLHFDVRDCPLPSNSVDAVVIAHMLQHTDADERALAQVRRILKPAGVVVFDVTVGPDCHDVYDRHLGQLQRYHLPALCALLERRGFHMLEPAHLGFLRVSTAVEEAFARWVRHPVGIRCTVAARKR